MDPVGSFTFDTFRDRIGERFVLAEPPLELELVEVVDHSRSAGGSRAPFSLVFRGPSDSPLEQGIHELTHPELGQFGLFLVPVASRPDGLRYEAVFS